MMTVQALPATLTVADLDAMPDDGHRYELIDGVLVVTPGPSREHQFASSEIVAGLRSFAPQGFVVLAAPGDVILSDDTLVQPDVFVVTRDNVRDKRALPVLAVEILSPSTRRFDLHTKRARLAAAGVPNYWVVDPLEPRVGAWHLVDGEYVEVADVAGNEALELADPFQLRIVPAELVI